ncbi:hypothetical protein X733_11005 [Mesorhizobium sp. L2C067A000]|nr:hypothetical protein X733_11005 [Mesorhizobium sp. L2C067A000]ESZ75005.1 hypothetical protein X726_20945 [Mesorhizobium sp. L103C105A0]
MPDLAGCHGAGANPAEAIADAASAMREWAEARIAKHLPMPNPRLWQIFCNPAKSTVPVATPP